MNALISVVDFNFLPLFLMSSDEVLVYFVRLVGVVCGHVFQDNGQTKVVSVVANGALGYGGRSTDEDRISVLDFLEAFKPHAELGSLRAVEVFA